MNLKENMKRFNTKNLNEQEMSYDQKVDKIKDNVGLNGAGRNYANSPLYNAYLEGQNITKNSPKSNVAKNYKGIKITTA